MQIPVSFILPKPKKIAVQIQPALQLAPVRIELLAARCTPRYQSRVMAQPRRLQLQIEPERR